MEYLLPRLRGWGESMSRQAGGRVAGGEGIGSRGPGETKIELDRRRIRTRMAKLRREIEDMQTARDTKRAGATPQRRPRPWRSPATPTPASPRLLNRLTGAGVLVEDALFATLDPTVRRAETPDGRVYTLTDTVGFVRHLPHQLVEAFRSTLEEVGRRRPLLHVVDGCAPRPRGAARRGPRGARRRRRRGRAARSSSSTRPTPPTPRSLGRLRRARAARDRRLGPHRRGLDELRRALIERELPRPARPGRRRSCRTTGATWSPGCTRDGEVLAEEHTADGTRLQAHVGPWLAAELTRTSATPQEATAG